MLDIMDSRAGQGGTTPLKVDVRRLTSSTYQCTGLSYTPPLKVDVMKLESPLPLIYWLELLMGGSLQE